LSNYFLVLLEDQPGGGMGMLSSLVPFILIIGVFYFLIIRPQQKRQKERTKLLAAVKVGDEVITAGGVYGKIDHIEENIVYLKISDNTKIKIEKSSVANIVGVTDKLAKK
jgi:preprotein translocase subunit YajC